MSEQPEHSETLDTLYEAMSEVQAHLGEHDEERKSLTLQVEAMEHDLLERRQAAAKAGERDTYNRLSEDLANLTRAWRALQQDPNADPLDEYQWTDEQPKDQPQPQESDDETEAARTAGDRGTSRSAGEATPRARPGDSGPGAQAEPDDLGGGGAPGRGDDRGV